MMFSKAIVRTPGKNFARGLTRMNLGTPDYRLALQQHADYCAALKRCGLEITVLPADVDYPDSTFVEDTAVLLKGHVIFTRPGASSRLGEVERIRPVLMESFDSFSEIIAPGTLDGGDICEAENHFFVGISERTNIEGANQFKQIVSRFGCTVDFIDIRPISEILHLKSGLAYLGDENLVLIESLLPYPALSSYRHILVASEETYAANCIRVNDQVLIARGFPKLADSLDKLGYSLISLDMSEFQKMDGGLSCLSLRF